MKKIIFSLLIMSSFTVNAYEGSREAMSFNGQDEACSWATNKVTSITELSGDDVEICSMESCSCETNDDTHTCSVDFTFEYLKFGGCK